MRKYKDTILFCCAIAGGLGGIACVLQVFGVQFHIGIVSMTTVRAFLLALALLLYVLTFGVLIYFRSKSREPKGIVVTEEVLLKIAKAGACTYLAHLADNLAKTLENVWHDWEAQGKKLINPLDRSVLPKVIEDWNHKQLQDFQWQYQWNIRYAIDQLQDFHTKFIDDGFPRNGEKYIDTKRKIEDHARRLRDYQIDLIRDVKNPSAKAVL